MNLAPIGVYNLQPFSQVLAVSHGMQSEPQSQYTAVLPNPARNLSILAVEDSKISLQWLPPVNSLLTEYNIRYKPVVRRWGWC